MRFTCHQNSLTSEAIFMFRRLHYYYSNICYYETLADVIHYDKFVMLKDIRAFIFNSLVAIKHIYLQTCKAIEVAFQISYFSQHTSIHYIYSFDKKHMNTSIILFNNISSFHNLSYKATSLFMIIDSPKFWKTNLHLFNLQIRHSFEVLDKQVVW